MVDRGLSNSNIVDNNSGNVTSFNSMCTSSCFQDDRTTMTLSMSVSDKQLLKMYSAKVGKPTSKILHDWIQTNCSSDLSL